MYCTFRSYGVVVLFICMLVPITYTLYVINIYHCDTADLFSCYTTSRNYRTGTYHVIVVSHHEQNVEVQHFCCSLPCLTSNDNGISNIPLNWNNTQLFPSAKFCLESPRAKKTFTFCPQRQDEAMWIMVPFLLAQNWCSAGDAFWNNLMRFSQHWWLDCA